MMTESIDTDRVALPADTGAGPRVARLEARGLTKSYRRGIWPRVRSLPVLRGADLSVRTGEIVGLVGENGSGKSTLMKILVGALAADGGVVEVAGRVGYCPRSEEHPSELQSLMRHSY